MEDLFGHLPRAVHELERSIALSPDLAEAYFHLVNAYPMPGQIDKRNALSRQILATQT